MAAARKKSVFIADLVSGQQIQEIFLVSRKKLAETKAGKPYLALSLMDKTGEIEARIWDKALEYDALAVEGSFVAVQATAKPFRDQMQLGVTSLQSINEDSVRLADFMPASERSTAEMIQELRLLLDSFSDQGLKNLLQALFQGQNLERFKKAPAAKKMHHAYLGGLMEHTLSVAGLAEQIAKHYPQLDRDLLVAGALLHDLAKIEEFEFSRPPFNYTDRGRLVGHLVLGVDLVRKAAADVCLLSEERLDMVLHMILSHHGQLNYGSPVLPMTPEAILLHHLDDMDAKMNLMEGLRRQIPKGGRQWTDYQRHMERYLYLQGEDSEDEQASASEQKSMPTPSQPVNSTAESAEHPEAQLALRQPKLF